MTTYVNFYDLFTKLEAVGLTLAQHLGTSGVLMWFAYIIFIWGLFEVFFIVYDKRDFMPFIHYIAYFSVMMLIFLHLNTANSVFSYIHFPAQIADGFTNGIISSLGQADVETAVNKALSDLDTKLVQNGPGNKVMPDANTPQKWQSLYALIDKNLEQIGSDCKLNSKMNIISPTYNVSTVYTGELASDLLYTKEYDSNGQSTPVKCGDAIQNVRSEMNNYIENYWKNTPTGKQIYQGGKYSGNISTTDYDSAVFLGGGNTDNIAIGSIISNSTSAGINKDNKGGLIFSLKAILNYLLTTIGSIEVVVMRISVQIMAPIMLYGMFMFNAIFYSVILVMTPIVFVLSMQKTTNIVMYVKWIFTVIWARSWEIIAFLLVNIYNGIQIGGSPGMMGAFTVYGLGPVILTSLWSITIITMTMISPGIMALVLLEGRAMITSAMVGMAGGLGIEHGAEKIADAIAPMLEKALGGGNGGGVGGGGSAGGGGGASASATGGPTSTGGGVGGAVGGAAGGGAPPTPPAAA